MKIARLPLVVAACLAFAGPLHAAVSIEFDADRRLHVFGALDYYLADSAGAGTKFDQAGKAHGFGLFFGYSPDAVHRSIQVSPGYGARLGALYTVDVLGGMDFGGSVGYLQGPKITAETSANDSTRGFKSDSYSAKSRILRVLFETRKRWSLNDSVMLSLGAGVGGARGKTDAVATTNEHGPYPDGSFSSSRTWSGLAWEITPSVEIPWRKFMVALGFRYAHFPTQKAAQSGDAYITEMAWSPLGLFLGISY